MAGLRVCKRAVSGRRRDTHPSVAARVPRFRFVAGWWLVRGAGIESSNACGSRQTRDFAIPKSVFVVDHSPRTVANHGVQLHVRAERPSAVLPVASRACSRSAPAQRIVGPYAGIEACPAQVIGSMSSLAAAIAGSAATHSRQCRQCKPSRYASTRREFPGKGRPFQPMPQTVRLRCSVQARCGCCSFTVTPNHFHRRAAYRSFRRSSASRVVLRNVVFSRSRCACLVAQAHAASFLFR